MQSGESNMRLFFANGLMATFTDRQITPSPPKSPNNTPEPPKLSGGFSAGILCEQLINSFIIAGIAAISTLAATGEGGATGKAAGIAFGLTFLIEMRKYRKI